ncbi:hypothetical protein P3W45_000568 [Vairimorpha bombi]|jgi:nucleolar protein 56
MQHLLYEHTKGYILFELKEYEDLSNESYKDYLKLTQVVHLVSKYDFDDVQMAYNNIQELSVNKIPPELRNFLELNEVKVLHCDPSLKQALKLINIKQKTSTNILRGIKQNESKFTKLENDTQFMLGVSHTFSRNKVEFNSKKDDNIMIHTVNMLDQLEKDINSYSMRIKELYGWSFPELFSHCNGNDEYIKVLNFFINKKNLPEEHKLEELIKLKNNLPEEHKLEELIKLKNNSIGIELNELDIMNIRNLCDIINEKIDIKNKLKIYLKDKMEKVAPNLCELLGDLMAAKIIVLSGGLMNLAKSTASTIQLLGAEKSLFQALKSRSNTPKYGVLFYSKYISKAHMKNKAKFSRYLAAKIAILSKIDCFSYNRTNEYGVAIKKIVKNKLKSFDNNKEVENTDVVMSRIYNKLKNC